MPVSSEEIYNLSARVMVANFHVFVRFINFASYGKLQPHVSRQLLLRQVTM